MKRQPGRIQPAWSREAEPELFSAVKLFNPLTEIKRCATCGSPDACFGVGYPDATRWLCRRHIGGLMPEVTEAFDRNRLREVRARAVKAARLWLDLHTAAGNGDADGCRGIWKHIRDVSVETSDFLKALGSETQK
jgi:hypothetical protein